VIQWLAATWQSNAQALSQSEEDAAAAAAADVDDDGGRAGTDANERAALAPSNGDLLRMKYRRCRLCIGASSSEYDPLSRDYRLVVRPLGALTNVPTHGLTDGRTNGHTVVRRNGRTDTPTGRCTEDARRSKRGSNS